jgi:hypothetical protein
MIVHGEYGVRAIGGAFGAIEFVSESRCRIGRSKGKCWPILEPRLGSLRVWYVQRGEGIAPKPCQTYLNHRGDPTS